MTVSKRRPIVAASTPLATAAFSRRAPSRWKRRSSSPQSSRSASISSSGQTRPPEALWLFSTQTTRVRGEWIAGTRYAARTCSGVKRPATPGSPRVTTPEWIAGPPSSEMKTWQFSSPRSSSPGSVCSRSAIWFAIVAVGR